MTKTTPSKKSVNLAFQGGGAHGAFAWGVLDKILEDGRLDIEGLTATSAGSMNAVVYAYHNLKYGVDGARQGLHDFWQKISQYGEVYSPIRRQPWEAWMNSFLPSDLQHWNMDHSMVYLWFESITRMFSPYQFNPLQINPLKNVLEKMVDFDAIHDCRCTKMFISTTNVRSGRVRVFKNEEITLDVVLASACLPFLFQAVEIDGQHYWDGGYMGNPALYPLFYHVDSRDIIILHINPIERAEVPTSTSAIMNRINEISFNSSLLKEFRAIAFADKLIDQDWLKDEHKDKVKRMLVHSIRADRALCDLSLVSKFDTSWQFLTHLRDKGREVAEEWLQRNYKNIGVRDSEDLHAEFLQQWQ